MGKVLLTLGALLAVLLASCAADATRIVSDGPFIDPNGGKGSSEGSDSGPLGKTTSAGARIDGNGQT
jgi:hypothetical protein